MKHNIPCVILCGGKSSRMGEDKALLPFGNFDTLVEYQHNKLSKLFKEVYISSKENKFNFSANLIYDNNPNISSPMVALDSIVQKLKSEKIFIITVDIPLVKKETIDLLINKSDAYTITIARDKNKTHNLCGIFNRSIQNTIKVLLEKDIHKINYMIKQTNNFQEILFNNKEQFINLNTVPEYEFAKKISSNYT